MQTFVTIVRARSFRKAAEELGVSRALVSKHLSDLERLLGAQLLSRTTRSLTLTEVGQRYYLVCVRLLTELENAETAVRDTQAGAGGRLRILAPRSFGSAGFATAMAEFVRLQPSMEVSLFLSDSGSHSFGSDGDVDVAIRLWDIPTDSSFVARRVAWLKWVTCAAPEYIDAAGDPKTLQELSKHECLLHPRLFPDRIWRFANGKTIKVSGRFTANSVLAIRRAALAGAGITQLPLYYVRSDLERGSLRLILEDHALRARPVYAVIQNSRFTPARVRTFMQFFSAWCRRAI